MEMVHVTPDIYLVEEHGLVVEINSTLCWTPML
nr:putative S protein [Maize chlorotic dwarf virus]